MARRLLNLLQYRTASLLLIALALANSGCLVIAAGAAGGAAGCAYAYGKGKVCSTYTAGFGDTWAALHTALQELGMPVVSEEREGLTGLVESKTADGERVRIHIDSLASKIPAEGEVTRVCVRVATFGDRPVSERLLDQISAHLAPVAALPQPGAKPAILQAGATAVQPPTAPTATQTAPPPLLPAEPVPAKPAGR